MLARLPDHPDGRLAVRWKGAELPYRLFDKLQRVEQGAEVDNNRLAAALAFAQEEQAKAPAPRRRAHNPSRRAQGPGPFSARGRGRHFYPAQAGNVSILR